MSGRFTQGVSTFNDKDERIGYRKRSKINNSKFEIEPL